MENAIFKIIWLSIWLFAAYYVYNDISDIPLSQLTLTMIGKNLLSLFFAYFAFHVFYDD